MKILKKSFYVPGLFTLTFLPLLLFFCLPQQQNFTVIRMNFPSDNCKSNTNIIAFSKCRFLKNIQSRKVETICLGDSFDNRKIKFIQSEVERIKFLSESSVIKIHLSDSTNYGEFIALLNIMISDDVKIYALIDDDFYIVVNRVLSKEQTKKIHPIDL